MTSWAAQAVSVANPFQEVVQRSLGVRQEPSQGVQFLARSTPQEVQGFGIPPSKITRAGRRLATLKLRSHKLGWLAKVARCHPPPHWWGWARLGVEPRPPAKTTCQSRGKGSESLAFTSPIFVPFSADLHTSGKKNRIRQHPAALWAPGQN